MSSTAERGALSEAARRILETRAPLHRRGEDELMDAQAFALSGLVTAVAFGASTSELVVGGLGAKRGAVVVVRDGKIVAASKEDADFPWKLVVDPSHKVAATLSQDGGVRVWTFGFDLERGPRASRQHHQAHDRHGVHGLVVPGHLDLRLVGARQLDELRRGPRVQATLIDDLDFGAGDHLSPART